MKFEDVCRKYYSAVKGFLAKRFSYLDPEEATQETFLAVWEVWGKEVIEDYKPWIIGVANRVAIRMARRMNASMRGRAVTGGWSLEAENKPDLETQEVALYSGQIQALFSGLTDAPRKAITLVAYEGHSKGMSSSQRMALTVARRELRKKLGDQEPYII